MFLVQPINKEKLMTLSLNDHFSSVVAAARLVRHDLRLYNTEIEALNETGVNSAEIYVDADALVAESSDYRILAASIQNFDDWGIISLALRSAVDVRLTKKQRLDRIERARVLLEEIEKLATTNPNA